MADARIRKLERAAGLSGDPLDAEQAARALGQAGRPDEACGLLARRERLTPAFLDELAPPTVAELLPTQLGEPYERKGLSHVAWAPDGATLYAVDDGVGLLAWDLATGARRVVAPLEGFAGALAVDAEGRRLLVASTPKRSSKLPHDLRVVDLASGKVGPAFSTDRSQVQQATFARGDPDLVLLRGRTSDEHWTGQWVQAFRLPSSARRGKALEPEWHMPAPIAGLHAGGFATVKRGKLAFHGLDAPDAQATLPTDCPGKFGDRLAGAHERVVVCTKELRLHAWTGELLASSAPPRNLHWPRQGCWTEVVAAPSGRAVAALSVLLELSLAHVGTGELVVHRFDVRPRRPAWSPSGRGLAVALDSGVIVVLRAGAPAPVASANGGWTDLVRRGEYGPASEWSGRAIGATVELRWNERGNRPNRRTVACVDEAAAQADLVRRVREKTGEGYAPG